MASERSDRPDGLEPDREATLVEHSSSGSRFTRLFGDTFSLEDGLRSSMLRQSLQYYSWW